MFWDAVFPGSLYLDEVVGETCLEPDASRRLVGTPFGDSFDQILSTAAQRVMDSYPAIIMLGDHDIDDSLVAKLESYVRRGGVLCITHDHAARLSHLQRLGRVEVFGVEPGDLDITRWTRPFTDETLNTVERKEMLALTPVEINFQQQVRDMLATLIEQHLPVTVDGDVQYIVNRNRDGWVVGLINNHGVHKTPLEPVVINPGAQRTVRVALKRGAPASVTEWTTGENLDVAGDTVTLTVPAGDVRIVHLAE